MVGYVTTHTGRVLSIIFSLNFVQLFHFTDVGTDLPVSVAAISQPNILPILLMKRGLTFVITRTGH